MDNSVGRVELVRSEICIVRGIEGVGLGNVVAFSSGIKGIVLGFDHEDAEVVVLSNFNQIKKGDLVRVIAKRQMIGISDQLIGRVISPLGEPMDGYGTIDIPQDSYYPIEEMARPIYQREIVNRPLQTGCMIIDSQIPIGLGQRELLLGEKKSGQNDTAIDIICNQARLKTDMICIYVAIAAETAGTKRRIEQLQMNSGLRNTIVVVGRTAEAASLNYITPMVGVTIAEWFANRGKDVLIVFDNLTQHAKVYRQMSLLLERPASREAYPGDVFYLHSRLLERCGAFSKEAGGGTITALPIVETQTEDMTDYITTNLMSITDGHVLFRRSLANKGNQPPIDSGFSVSRIGGQAQLPLMRRLSEVFRSITVRYEEVAHYMSFGNDVGYESYAAYELGLRAQAILQQGHDDFCSTVAECFLIYMVVSQKIKEWDVSQIPKLKRSVIEFIGSAPYVDILNQSILSMDYEHVEVAFNECLSDYLKSENAVKPVKKVASSVAEIETLDDILRSDDEILR